MFKTIFFNLALLVKSFLIAASAAFVLMVIILLGSMGFAFVLDHMIAITLILTGGK